MPTLKLKVKGMATNKVQFVTDHTEKFDTTLINEINSNGIKSNMSVNDIKKILKEILTDCDIDPIEKDRSGKPLSSSLGRLKKCLGNEKFIALLLQLPIEEQKTWMVETYKEICPDLPTNLVELLPGAFHPGDCGRPMTDKPDWLDMEKFRKGQQFMKDNYTMAWLSIIYGFYILFNIDDALIPIIMNNKSHTPYKSFKRYLFTVKRLDEIFFGDPWTEGTPAHKEVQNIRMQHLGVRQKLCKYDNETISNASAIQNPYAPKYDIIRKDIDTYFPTPTQGQCPFNMWTSKESGKPKSMNQTAIAITQCGFIGFVITQPEAIGIYNPTDENLEAFCHMWRGIGYLLGLLDEFNFCQGNLEEIKERVRNVHEYWMKPSFVHYNKEAEHASRAVYDGVNYFFIAMDFEVITLQLSKLLNVQMPNLYASLSYPKWIFYNSFNLLTGYLFNIPFVRKGTNMFFMYLKKRALEFDAKKLAKLREKSNKSPLNVPLGRSLILTQ